MLSAKTAKLITALHHKKYRKEENLFIAEGDKVVSELLASHYRLRMLFCTEDFIVAHSKSSMYSDLAELTIVTETELGKISALSTPQHVLAVAEIPIEESSIDYSKGLKLVLDGVKDPGNLGTLLRTADWFGIDEVICSPDSVDCYNPKVVQAAMGSLFRLQVIYEELQEVFSSNLFHKQLPVYGTLLRGNNIYKEKLLPDGFILIGNESTGIAKENRTFITNPLTIPSSKAGHPDSLNVAVAAAIVCSEFFRTR